MLIDIDDNPPADIAAAIEQARVATGGSINLFRVLALNPGLFRRYVPFGGRLLHRSSFDPRDRELMILRTAWLCRCEYEWEHHRRLGSESGLTAAEIAAAGGGGDDDVSDRQRMLLSAVDDLVASHRVDAAVWERLRRDLTPAQLVELPILIGHYAMIAGLVNSVALSLEDASASVAGKGGGGQCDPPSGA